jgi:uncharacterized protein YyaL (SSP411 family)
LNSGIVNKSNRAEEHGGCYAWYDSEQRRYSFLYSEITGYFLSLCVFLTQNSFNDHCLRRAEDAAQWLIKTMQTAEGGFICSRSGYLPNKDSLVYVFDTGIIINGLVNIYRVTHNDEYLQAAIRASKWLLSQERTGSLAPVYDYIRKDHVHQESWSFLPTGYQSKIAAALCNLYDITKDGALLGLIERICTHARSLQKMNGSFCSVPEKEIIHLHPHCYATEGLLIAGLALHNPEYLLSAYHGIQWLIHVLETHGTVPRIISSAETITAQRTDVIAQVFRLLVYYQQIFPDAAVRAAAHIQSLYETLQQYYVMSDDVHCAGSYYFGYSTQGERLSHCNSWATMFAVQGTIMYAAKAKDKNNLPLYSFL